MLFSRINFDGGSALMAVRPSKNWPLQHEASDSVSRHALALTLTPTPPPARNTMTTNCCCCCSEPLSPWPCPWLWPSPLTPELWSLTLTTVAEPRAETQLAIWLSTILALHWPCRCNECVSQVAVGALTMTISFGRCGANSFK